MAVTSRTMPMTRALSCSTAARRAAKKSGWVTGGDSYLSQYLSIIAFSSASVMTFPSPLRVRSRHRIERDNPPRNSDRCHLRQAVHANTDWGTPSLHRAQHSSNRLQFPQYSSSSTHHRTRTLTVQNVGQQRCQRLPLKHSQLELAFTGRRRGDHGFTVLARSIFAAVSTASRRAARARTSMGMLLI